MTSVSVSFEVRRLLNSLKSIENEKSVDELLKAVLKEHRMNRLKAESDALRSRISAVDGGSVDDVIERLQLAPW